MLNYLKRRFRDMRTVATLCQNAEKLANSSGRSEPGAEHFVLAALSLPDGTAQRAFQRLHVDSDQFRHAIDQQYADALCSVGINLPENSVFERPALARPGSKLYKGHASAQALMQRLSEIGKDKKEKPLLGAHVVLAAISAQFGVIPRALQVMGIDPVILADAARMEIDLIQAS